MKYYKYILLASITGLFQSCGFFQPNNSVSDHAKSLDKGDSEVSAGFTTHMFSTWQVGARGKYGISDHYDIGANASFNSYIDTGIINYNSNGRPKLTYRGMMHAQIYNKVSIIKNIAIAANIGGYFQSGFRPKWEFDPTLLFSFYPSDDQFSITPFLGYKYIFDVGDFSQSNYQLGVVLTIITDKSLVIRPELSINFNNRPSPIPLPAINFGCAIGYQFINPKNRIKELEEEEKKEEDSNYDDYVPEEGYKK